MRRIVSAVGLAVAVSVASWALFLDLAILYETHGLWSGVAGLVLAPVTFLVVPWYAWLALDNWLPLAVGYGGAIVAIGCALGITKLKRGQ